MALDVLQSEESGEPLRAWAVKTLNYYAEIKFEEASDELPSQLKRGSERFPSARGDPSRNVGTLIGVLSRHLYSKIRFSSLKRDRRTRSAVRDFAVKSFGSKADMLKAWSEHVLGKALNLEDAIRMIEYEHVWVVTASRMGGGVPDDVYIQGVRDALVQWLELQSKK